MKNTNITDCNTGKTVSETELRSAVQRVLDGEVLYLSYVIEQCGPECHGGCAWEFASRLLADRTRTV